MNFLTLKLNEEVLLKSQGELPEQVHLFDDDSIKAVNAALAARRPLLVRGEPGVGKSQLARAVAAKLERAFVPYVVDMHTESHDLLWYFDAVQRLADAQLGKALASDTDAIKEKLAIRNYIHPGPLWWAFDWKDAEKQANDLKLQVPPQCEDFKPENGCVVLIDEIDKAEMDIPNGLLEALGEGCFTPKGQQSSVCASAHFPLVIITTNEERALPAAFLRRCLVLNIDPFVGDDGGLKTLIERGHAHFPALDKDAVITKAAKLLLKDRKAMKGQHILPGQAEFLDLLRAVFHLASDDKKAEDWIDDISRFVMHKQAGIKG